MLVASLQRVLHACYGRARRGFFAPPRTLFLSALTRIHSFCALSLRLRSCWLKTCCGRRWLHTARCGTRGAGPEGRDQRGGTRGVVQRGLKVEAPALLPCPFIHTRTHALRACTCSSHPPPHRAHTRRRRLAACTHRLYLCCCSPHPCLLLSPKTFSPITLPIDPCNPTHRRPIRWWGPHTAPLPRCCPLRIVPSRWVQASHLSAGDACHTWANFHPRSHVWPFHGTRAHTFD